MKLLHVQRTLSVLGLMLAVAAVIDTIACGGEQWTAQDTATSQRDRRLADYGYAHAMALPDAGSLAADNEAIFCDQEHELLIHHQPVAEGGIKCR